MAKIMLLDFDESDYRRLSDKKYDVELKETNWRSGRVKSLLPSQDCRVVLCTTPPDRRPGGVGLSDKS